VPGIHTAEYGCDARLQAEPFVREDVQRIASGSVADHAVVFIDPLSPVSTPNNAHAVTPWGAVPAPRTLHAIVLRI